MSFSYTDNERYTDGLVALAEGNYDALAAACAGRRFEKDKRAGVRKPEVSAPARTG